MSWKVRYCSLEEWKKYKLTYNPSSIKWNIDPRDFNKKIEAKEARNIMNKKYSNRYITIKYIKR